MYDLMVKARVLEERLDVLVATDLAQPLTRLRVDGATLGRIPSKIFPSKRQTGLRTHLVF